MNLEDLKFIINRFDHYYDTANNKGNFYIGYNIFVLGGIIGIKKDFHITHNIDLTNSMLLLLCFCCCLSIFYILLSSTPYLKSGNHGQHKSLLFFDSISKMNKEEYLSKISDSTSDKLEYDLILQVNKLADGLSIKYSYLKYAGYCIMVQILLLLIIIFKLILI